MPTERFERSVESKLIRISFAATPMRISGLATRSRIGLPYLCSPIWK